MALVLPCTNNEMQCNQFSTNEFPMNEFSSASDKDNQTVISDITTDSDTGIVKEDLENFKNVELSNVDNQLKKLTLDNLKDKCKMYNLGPLSKLKKNDIIDLLTNSFIKLCNTMLSKNVTELKDICKLKEYINTNVKNLLPR